MSTSIVLDTETTGIDPKVDKICEIAAVDADRNSSVPPFSQICNPGRDIPPEAMAIHHIRQHETLGCPSPGEAFVDLLEHFDYPQHIIAHHAKFDKAFLLPLMPPGYDPIFVCTMRSAWMIWPEAPRYTNQVLRYWLGLEPDLPAGLAPHRALYDIICTRDILCEERKHAQPDQLIYWSNNKVLLPKISFGKHAGKKFSELDYGYLRWLVQNVTDDEDVNFTAQHYMRSR